MTRYLTIDVDGHAAIAEFDPDGLREFLGGWFDVVEVDLSPVLEDVRCDWWINEDGKAMCPMNLGASAIAHRFGAIYADDYVSGPVAISGPCDADGETTDVTTEIVAAIVGAAIVLRNDPEAPPLVEAPTMMQEAAEAVWAGVDVIVVPSPRPENA